jgi:hypothetical protein
MEARLVESDLHVRKEANLNVTSRPCHSVVPNGGLRLAPARLMFTESNLSLYVPTLELATIAMPLESDANSLQLMAHRSPDVLGNRFIYCDRSCADLVEQMRRQG